MTSAIDITKPVTGSPTTQSVRDNFTTAKSEIEALQDRVGFADYNDNGTVASPIAVSVSTWTKLTNDKLGANTTIHLPDGITNLWDATNGELFLDEVPLYSMVDVRADLLVTTSAANQAVKFRTRLAIGHASEFSLEANGMHFKTAGAQNVAINSSFYIGSIPVRDNPGRFEIWSDATCTVRVNGWYIRVIKHIP